MVQPAEPRAAARLRRLSAHLRSSVGGCAAAAAEATDRVGDWGASRGYPATPAGYRNKEGAKLDDRRVTRVANYSGGYEAAFPLRTIRAGATVSPLSEAAKYQREFRYRWGSEMRRPEDYFRSFPVTGLLIARKGQVFVEHYCHGRNAQMRMQSWSMAKSITSLLLGACVDRGLVASIDDEAARYVPELRGTLHGGVTLRNLLNMSSGAKILHASKDYATLYPRGMTADGADITPLVAGWNARSGAQGRQFNYNELCALAIGMVIRRVTGRSMSEFAEEALWQPLGAEADAVWSTDSKGAEFNCVGFGARLRDWARVGQLVAQRGMMGGRRVLSDAWITEITSWGPRDQHVLWTKGRHANSTKLLEEGMLGVGYKAFMWHQKPDGSQPTFSGHNGQMMIVDMPSQTVLVVTGVSEEGPWQIELAAMLQAAVNMRS